MVNRCNQSMTYRVKLHIFEGPLDLLLYLIKKNEMDIFNIPIAEITRQYLEYLEIIQLLDVNLAGEFVAMAATLMQIKSAMLLPKEETPEEEEPDPREELMRRLLEYQRFKDAAQTLAGLESQQLHVFPRAGEVPVETDAAPEEGDGRYFEATLFDLLTAFSKVLAEIPKDTFYQVIKDECTVEEKVHELLHLLVTRKSVQLQELLAQQKNKIHIIATFLAVLELIRQKEVAAQQHEPFGPILLCRREDQMRAAPAASTSI